MFLDYLELRLISGKGGDGCMAFHREKYVPRGGPSGGDGGNGADIVMICDHNLTTLMDFNYKKIYKGRRGPHGKGSKMHGKNQEPIVIKVPLGTVVKNLDSDEILADFIQDGQTEIIARGGRGGRGNARFATPTNQAPTFHEEGRDGIEMNISIEVKLFADVGLVGLPNAGKSTLLSVLSDARPKVADYPFTTLEPQLGIVKHYDYKSFVMADIPGIIEGAHEGKGLGHKFLRHIERTKTIAYVIDGNDIYIDKTYETLKKELNEYSPHLAEKPAVVLVTKADTYEEDWIDLPKFDYPHIVISSIARQNLQPLKEILWENIEKGREMFDYDDLEEENDEFDF
jgi:GTP-binding protein